MLLKCQNVAGRNTKVMADSAIDPAPDTIKLATRHETYYGTCNRESVKDYIYRAFNACEAL